MKDTKSPQATVKLNVHHQHPGNKHQNDRERISISNFISEGISIPGLARQCQTMTPHAQ